MPHISESLGLICCDRTIVVYGTDFSVFDPWFHGCSNCKRYLMKTRNAHDEGTTGSAD